MLYCATAEIYGFAPCGGRTAVEPTISFERSSVDEYVSSYTTPWWGIGMLMTPFRAMMCVAAVNPEALHGCPILYPGFVMSTDSRTSLRLQVFPFS